MGRVLAKVLKTTMAMTTLAGGLALVGVDPASAAVSSIRMNWSIDASSRYIFGIDAVNTAGVSPGGYEATFEQVPAGASDCNGNMSAMPNPYTLSPGFAMSELRLEIYSFPANTCGGYDPNRGDGGVVVRVPGTSANVDLGQISVPKLGEGGTGRLTGQVKSHTAVGTERVSIDIFQVTNFHQTSSGVRLDAFSSGKNAGAAYQTGPLWDGQYIAFVTDHVNGTKATGLIDVNGLTNFDLDLDVPCFGIDNCEFTGSVTPPPGGYHAVGPNRILDSRKNVGIVGAVEPGDGRNSDPNDVHRRETRLNHEFVVAGVGGVPATGVSAVLLNVTTTQGQAGGVAKIFPKPANTTWYEDESSFATTNPAGPLIVWGPGEDIANLVLVPVGVGGRLRVENFSGGSVHLIADVVGWFDSSQPGQSGAGLTAIAPDRFLDTRQGAGGPKAPFAAGETRSVQVAGRGAIPSDATAVVGTMTGVAPTAQTYLTVWPAGAPASETSVLNLPAGDVRPNLVTVGVGAGSAWSIFNPAGNHDVLFDASGYFRNGSGGLVTPVTAATVLDTQGGNGGPRSSFGGGETRTLQVAGRGGVPADATAVYLSVTASFTTSFGYLTIWNGGPRPDTSNLNWDANEAKSNLVLVPLAADGTVQLYNAFGNVHLVADVVAYVK